jgi:hypothetical protein
MNREAIRRHLVQADNRVASGERTIARRWAIVTELARDSQDTSEAKSMIAAFEQTLRLQIADRNRIRAELACCSDVDFGEGRTHASDDEVLR